MTRATFSKISPISASLTIKRRGDRQGIAGDPDHQVLVVEGPFHGLVAALAGGAGPRRKVDAGRNADRAHVEHAGQALQRHRGVGIERLEPLCPLEQALVAVKIERREAGRASERMRRIGVAVEQLDHVLRAVHEGIVDALRTQSRRPSARRRRSRLWRT